MLLPVELTPPSAVRPKTTTAVARRLIGSALGNTAVSVACWVAAGRERCKDLGD
jgi:hypothetical protein